MTSDRPHVRCDPAQNYGQASVKAVRCEAIAGMLWAGETLETVADEYSLTRHEVLVACWWIGEFGPWRWRRRWRQWAKAAHAQLWHGRYETIPDPPRRPR